LVKTGSNLPRRAMATGLAACAHLLVLLLLGWKVPRLVVPSRRDDAPALQVTLVRPQVRLRGEPAPRKERPAPSRPPATSARVLTQPAPQAPLSAVTPPKTASAAPEATPAPVPPDFETSPDGDHVRSALRGLIGCTGALAQRLGHAEREACDQKLAATKPAAVGPLYSAKEAETFDNPNKESIFVRKPHNECLPHIGHRSPPPGAGPVAANGLATTAFGLACAWSFR
jgi:hypothetical protein